MQDNNEDWTLAREQKSTKIVPVTYGQILREYIPVITVLLLILLIIVLVSFYWRETHVPVKAKADTAVLMEQLQQVKAQQAKNLDLTNKVEVPKAAVNPVQENKPKPVAEADVPGIKTPPPNIVYRELTESETDKVLGDEPVESQVDDSYYADVISQLTQEVNKARTDERIAKAKMSKLLVKTKEMEKAQLRLKKRGTVVKVLRNCPPPASKSTYGPPFVRGQCREGYVQVSEYLCKHVNNPGDIVVMPNNLKKGK